MIGVDAICKYFNFFKYGSKSIKLIINGISQYHYIKLYWRVKVQDLINFNFKKITPKKGAI